MSVDDVTCLPKDPDGKIGDRLGSFQILFFEGFTLAALPFTETKRTLCICVMKNVIYRAI